MIVGCPKEVKINENRVALVIAGVRALVEAGHSVIIEKDAGFGSGISNEEYKIAGAKIVPTNKEVFKNAELIMKVKEPSEDEIDLFQKNQILYTFLHLVAAPKIAKGLKKKKVRAIAYETIELPDGRLPVLTPMSEIAGRMATHVGAYLLQKEPKEGGKGLLLGGVPGVKKGKVTVLGGGVAGTNAAKIAIGLGANVTILDVNAKRLEYLDDIFGNRITTLRSNITNIEESVATSDLLIGTVLITGGTAPRLVTRKMIETMEEGSVVIDVSVDQGGCIETTKPTTHDKPTYRVNGVIHYAVTNIPGAVPHTATYALTNASFPYAFKIAQLGFDEAIKTDPALKKGVNVYNGFITCERVARDLNLSYKSVTDIL
ncbi:MAG: alanine dehydrogenase [Deltaproteobacteria bacterium]|nr:alanine dehydrogenase [Deltaproteobacteria bacterium]